MTRERDRRPWSRSRWWTPAISLGGPGRDERWAFIDTTANALTGLVLIVAILVLWPYEIATGDDGSPYAGLAALAGVTYVLAIAWLRARS